MTRRLSIFLSSTSKDLEHYRDQLADTIVQLGMYPITMQAFTPTGDNPVQMSYNYLQEADVFVGIYANRYGYIPDSDVSYTTADGAQRQPDGETGITHMEYQWAREREIPLLLYVMENAETQPNANPVDRRRAAAFREMILEQHVVGFFSTQEELARKVTVGLASLPLPNVVAGERARSEARLLRLVDTWWIKNTLEASLHDALEIELVYEATTYNPFQQDYNNPREARVDRVRQEELLKVFDDFAHHLLLLGAPGSGKTISLLGMARRMIAIAQQNAAARVPAVFTLSSWQEPLTIYQWLVLELTSKYTISRREAQDLVDGNRLICLLDGLDLLEPEQRQACVVALNAYMNEYDAALVICSRTLEYEALSERLQVIGAVTVQPLQLAQVQTYLRRLSGDFSTLLARMEQDYELATILTTPLMVYIAVVAARNVAAGGLQQPSTAGGWYEYLFSTYLGKILEPLKPEERAGIQDHLRWLAQRLSEQNQAIFYIDNMGTELLPQRNLRWSIRGFTAAIYGGAVLLTLILAYNVGYYMHFGALWGVPWQVSIPAAVGLWFAAWQSAGLLASRLSVEQIEIIVSREWSAENIRENLFSGMWRGLLVGLLVGGVASLPTLIVGTIGYYILQFNLLFSGVVAAGVSTVLLALGIGFVLQRMRGLGLLGPLVAGAVAGLTFGLTTDALSLIFPLEELEPYFIEGTLIVLRAYTLPSGLAIGLAWGTTRSWNYLLRYGLNVTAAEADTIVMAPTLKQTTRNAQIFTVVFASVGAIVGAVATVVVMYASVAAGAFGTTGPIWDMFGYPFPLVVAFGTAVIYGTAAFREFGGLIAIQQILTRWSLRWQGRIPRDYTAFLNDLAKRRLLHRVGVGYRFFHDLFQDYMAGNKFRL